MVEVDDTARRPYDGRDVSGVMVRRVSAVSRYAFVEPALDMRQDTWLLANVAMFEWFGGTVPRVVPDNLKTGVIKHPREGEIVLNDAYR